ncbi:AAA family ATPase [Nonomuraea sp. NPDC055795]
MLAGAEVALDTYQVAAGLEFSPAQRQALERLLGGGHGADAVIGVAGAGKTTLMAAARTAWQAHGLVVAGASTAAVAAAHLQAESGIASLTIAGWLLRDPLEREALELRRAGQHERALRVWGEGGHVHAGDGATDTMARLVADWAQARQPYTRTSETRAGAAAGVRAVHDELAAVLVLAGTNEAAERLNLAARAVRRELGEITGPDRVYTLALAVGDHVRVRKNDYRARRGEDDVDVLNGYRGHVTHLDDQGGLTVQWRVHGPDGPRLKQARFGRDDVAGGSLSYGTAMTVAAAQGLAGERTLVYGLGLDPNTLYPAMSRDRESAHLYTCRATCWRPTTTGPGSASHAARPTRCAARRPPTPGT